MTSGTLTEISELSPQSSEKPGALEVSAFGVLSKGDIYYRVLSLHLTSTGGMSA